MLQTALSNDPRDASCQGNSNCGAVLAIHLYDNMRTITYVLTLQGIVKRYLNVPRTAAYNMQITAPQHELRCKASDVFVVM